jgi:hypothetical protein
VDAIRPHRTYRLTSVEKGSTVTIGPRNARD